MNHFVAFIEEKVKLLQQEEQELAASDRKDEANLMKIRINVYGICRTVYEVYAKTKAGTVLKQAYLEKLETLSHSWKVSMEKAKEYGDMEKAVVEEIKLQPLEEVRIKYMELKEDGV